MWDLLQRADIDRARQQLERRRAAILKRQAEELGQLDADDGELDTLNRLADAFAQKYVKAPEALAATPAPPVEQAPLEQAPPIERAPPAAKVAPNVLVRKQPPEPRRPEQRDYGRTNFGTFSRAVERSIF